MRCEYLCGKYFLPRNLTLFTIFLKIFAEFMLRDPSKGTTAGPWGVGNMDVGWFSSQTTGRLLSWNQSVETGRINPCNWPQSLLVL